MATVFGVCCVIAGLAGVLFPRHIAKFVVQTFRKMGGQISEPAPISILSFFYRIIGVVQLGLGIAVLIYAA